MALHFPLKVNNETIGVFEAVRTAGGTRPDDINTYWVTIRTEEPMRTFEFAVDHRYGDGAWGLVRKALAVIEEEHP